MEEKSEPLYIFDGGGGKFPSGEADGRRVPARAKVYGPGRETEIEAVG